jgi:DNA-binding NarL/FixJ family response regulator
MGRQSLHPDRQAASTVSDPQPKGEPVSVILVDDQPLLRKGFRMVLEEEPGLMVVGEASDGAAALDLVRLRHPDVVVMDVRMPGMDGLEATRAITMAEPRSRILILTTFDLDEYAFNALRLGASGFILKDVVPAEFVRAVRSVADGDAVIAPSVTRRLLDAFAHEIPGPQQADGASHPELEQLTTREREILVELAGGFSNAEIAARLFVAEATVKTHLGRVLAKLGLRDRVQAVVYAYEVGLVDPRSKHLTGTGATGHADAEHPAPSMENVVRRQVPGARSAGRSAHRSRTRKT